MTPRTLYSNQFLSVLNAMEGTTRTEKHAYYALLNFFAAGRPPLDPPMALKSLLFAAANHPMAPDAVVPLLLQAGLAGLYAVKLITKLGTLRREMELLRDGSPDLHQKANEFQHTSTLLEGHVGSYMEYVKQAAFLYDYSMTLEQLYDSTVAPSPDEDKKVN